MRVDRSLKLITILATITACGAPAATPDAAPPAAAAPAPVAAAPDPVVVAAPEPQGGVSVRWDSRPLDTEYRRERDNFDSRWKVEITTGRPGESRAERERRRAAEQQALDARYERGKREHMRRLPPG